MPTTAISPLATDPMAINVSLAQSPLTLILAGVVLFILLAGLIFGFLLLFKRTWFYVMDKWIWKHAPELVFRKLGTAKHDLEYPIGRKPRFNFSEDYFPLARTAEEWTPEKFILKRRMNLGRREVGARLLYKLEGLPEPVVTELESHPENPAEHAVLGLDNRFVFFIKRNPSEI